MTASASPTQKILSSRQGPVTTITINRPHVRNALDREATALLLEAVRAFEADDNARVAVMVGAGGTFCSGADLKEIACGQMYDPWAGSENGFLRHPPKKPVLAAVAGHACAGGLGLALWCDLRIVEEGARFAVLSRRWGVPMSDGTTVRLPRLIGMSNALDLLLTARMVSASEALQMGLANRVVAKGAALHEAQALALQIAEFPPIAMLSDRLSTYEQADHPADAAIMHEADLSARARSLEAQGGADRFAKGAGRHGEVTVKFAG